jgi:ABC-type antimicrobial peptide transport system permease subunit
MLATLVGIFGAVALLLAAVGLYGVMAHVANQRTPEIGIRVAMGAKPSSIVRLLVGQGLRLLGIGAAIGLSCALGGTRLIEAQLFGVTATDPLTFAVGTAVLAISGMLASAIPALRAMRVDPIVVLRQA